MSAIATKTWRIAQRESWLELARARMGRRASSDPDHCGMTYREGPEAFALVLCDGTGGWSSGWEGSVAAAPHLSVWCADGPDTEPLLTPEGANVAARKEWADEAKATNAAAQLRAAFYNANQYTKAAFRGDNDGSHSATVLMLRGGDAYVGWCGGCESRLIRGGKIIAQTHSHHLWRKLVANGMSEEEARRSPHARISTRGIGNISSDENGPEIVGPWRLKHGDIVIVTSVFVGDVLSDADVVAAAQRSEPDEIVTHLMELASQRRGTEFEDAIVVAGRFIAGKP